MHEIRYRLRRAGGPGLFHAWFDGAPDARIHATNMRFGADETACTLVACGDAATLAANMAAAPAPPSRRWRIAAPAPRLVVVDAMWGEPAFGRARSPSRLAHDVFGDDARCAFTLTADSVLHRVLVPETAVVDGLWDELLDALDTYRSLIGNDVRCELERVATRELRPDPHDPDFLRVVEHAFDLGLLDNPQTATPEELAAFLGMPAKQVEAYVHEARMPPPPSLPRES